MVLAEPDTMAEPKVDLVELVGLLHTPLTSHLEMVGRALMELPVVEIREEPAVQR